jgi:hypothetical protein
MSTYTYKVVPFIGTLKGGVFNVETAEKVSDQLQELIDTYTQQGWEFYRIDAVQIQIQPGCLASLFGQRTSWINFDQVIFRQPVGT